MKKIAIIFFLLLSINLWSQIPPQRLDNDEMILFDCALEMAYLPDWRIKWIDNGIDLNGDGNIDENYNASSCPTISFYAQFECYFTLFNFAVISGSIRNYFLLCDTKIIDYGFDPVLDYYSIGAHFYLTSNIIAGIYHYCFHPVIVSGNLDEYKRIMGVTGYEGAATVIYFRIQSY